ncbi:MAG: CoA-binding protein [Thermodesulfobacteriota bacterium]|nr:CoA-binding protein [Thermodesulfobacteriota bacterium]
MANIHCELPEYNPPSGEVKAVLIEYKTVAVVGLSPKPERDSHKVARYLKEQGYDIIPVNPGQKEILGSKSYPNLKAIPFPVDIVDIFRRPEAIPPIVDDAIEIGAKVVWMQLGIANNQAAEKAREAGLQVVMSKCIKVEHMNMAK